jgi:hypothetical protein
VVPTCESSIFTAAPVSDELEGVGGHLAQQHLFAFGLHAHRRERAGLADLQQRQHQVVVRFFASAGAQQLAGDEVLERGQLSEVRRRAVIAAEQRALTFHAKNDTRGLGAVDAEELQPLELVRDEPRHGRRDLRGDAFDSEIHHGEPGGGFTGCEDERECVADHERALQNESAPTSRAISRGVR